MALEEAILEKFLALPPERQQEVVDFAEFLLSKPSVGRKSPEGLWADPGVSVSLEDIAEVRKEMSKNFPRDI